MSRRLGLASALAAIVSIAAACGYRPLHTASGEATRLHVVLVGARVADAVANDEVVSGLRVALAREGALAPGAGYPRVEVEVLRADETSEAIAVARDGAGERVPRARATQVGIVARAWIVRTPDGAREADTGDVRALDRVESPGTDCALGDDSADCAGAAALFTESMRHDDALRAVARRVGEKLAARVLGHPVARDESPAELW